MTNLRFPSHYRESPGALGFDCGVVGRFEGCDGDLVGLGMVPSRLPGHLLFANGIPSPPFDINDWVSSDA